MHEIKIAHRDIKPDNVVFSLDTKDSDEFDISNLQLKLIDFGFATFTDPSYPSLTDMIGTPYFTAPEIILGLKYGTSCDIWSLGVLTYFIISGEYPFTGPDANTLLHNIVTQGSWKFKSPIWDQVTSECKDFIT